MRSVLLAVSAGTGYPLARCSDLGATWREATTPTGASTRTTIPAGPPATVTLKTYPGYAVTYRVGSTNGDTMQLNCAPDASGNGYAQSWGDGWLQWGPVNNQYSQIVCQAKCENSVGSCNFIACEQYTASEDLTLAAGAECANKEFDQCGGKEWAGATCCRYGQECQEDNEWFSKCVRLPVCENKEYGQCGGKDWGEKPTCCVPGYECQKESEWFSQCRPSGSGLERCAEGWAQCGGKDFTGEPCCKDGFICEAESEFYHQCKPACTNALYDQCAGKANGFDKKATEQQKCCPEGTRCAEESEWYSQCRPEGDAGQNLQV